MGKFKIDFTPAEKRKLWKAGLSLRKMGGYSFQQIFDAIGASPEREEQIREQYFADPFGDVMGLSPGVFSEPLLSANLLGGTGLSAGLNNAASLINRSQSILPPGMSSMIAAVSQSAALHEKIYSGTMQGLGLVNAAKMGLDSSLLDSTASARMMLDSIPQIAKTMANINGGNSGMDRLLSPAAQNAMLGIFSSRDITHEFFKPLSNQISAAALGLSGYTTLCKDTNSVLDAVRSAGMAFRGLTSIMPNQAAISNSLLQQDFYKTHDLGSIVNSITSASVFEKTYLSTVGLALSATTSLTKMAEQNLGTFKWESVGRRVALSERQMHATQKGFMDLTAGYGDLLRSISGKPNWIYESPLTAKISSEDYYLGSRMLRIVSVEEADAIAIETEDEEIDAENKDTIGLYLPMVDADLPDLWNGAILAMQSNNPDKSRHMITSLRELYTHVLHLLAPDDAFVKWDTFKEHYDNNKPTRRGRFLYLCRNLEGSNNQFAKLLTAEIDTTLKLIGLFNGGTHAIKSSFSPMELEFIRIKAETTLRTFLMVEFEINRK